MITASYAYIHTYIHAYIHTDIHVNTYKYTHVYRDAFYTCRMKNITCIYVYIYIKPG